MAASILVDHYIYIYIYTPPPLTPWNLVTWGHGGYFRSPPLHCHVLVPPPRRPSTVLFSFGQPPRRRRSHQPRSIATLQRSVLPDRRRHRVIKQLPLSCYTAELIFLTYRETILRTYVHFCDAGTMLRDWKLGLDAGLDLEPSRRWRS